MFLGMHELLKRKLEETRTEVWTFFRIAHVYYFASDPDISNDVAQYRMHAILPIYVVNYLTMLREQQPSS